VFHLCLPLSSPTGTVREYLFGQNYEVYMDTGCVFRKIYGLAKLMWILKYIYNYQRRRHVGGW